MTAPIPSSTTNGNAAAPRTWATWLVHELRLFFVALQFFTRVPVPRWVGFEPDWLNQCARHFALIGVFVGVVAAVVPWNSQLFLVAVLVAQRATDNAGINLSGKRLFLLVHYLLC